MNSDPKTAGSSQVKSYLYRVLEVLREDGKGNVYAVCPSCGSDEGKFAVNIHKKLFNCYRASCGFKGNMRTLVKQFGPMDTEYEFQEGELIQGSKKGEETVELQVSGYYQIWDQYFQPLTNILGTLLYDRIDLLCQAKNTTIQELIRKDFRVCTSYFQEEKYYGRCNGYLAMPYKFADNKIHYWQYRRLPGLEDAISIKYKFPKEIGNWKKTNYVWFSDPLSDSSTKFISEAIFDANRLGGTAIAIGGANVAVNQLNLIRATNAKCYRVLMDGDTPITVNGKIVIPGLEATKQVATLLQQYTLAKVMVPPQNYFGSGKDPDELSDEELVNLCQNMREFKGGVTF